MAIMDNLENKFENMISTLSDKEKIAIRGIKNFMLNIYNNIIKNILIAIFMFWMFSKIKTIVGLQEAMFIQMTTIIVFLRIINSKIH
jgi:hypothetical protein